MQALHKQLDFELKRFGVQKKQLKTLFFGGGTPSTIAAKLYEPIFIFLEPYLASDAEITTEANPNSATKEWLEAMKNFGVNRVSFGVQSFDDAKLKKLGRAHSAKEAKVALKAAKDVGYKHISLDLIYGVAGDTKALLFHDVAVANSFGIDHLSAYALSIEANTPFAKNPKIAKEEIELTKELFGKIQSYGLNQYEISNFGKYKSRHNLGYWEYEDYIGAGCGAVGKLKTKRFYPQTNLQAYIQNPLFIDEEPLSKEDTLFEKIFLGLRSCVGVAKELLNPTMLQKAEILVDEKKLTYKNEHFYSSDFLVADEIALFLAT